MKKILLIICILICFLCAFCFIPISARKFIPLLKTQIEAQYGYSVYLDKLVFRFGPEIAIKSPKVKVLYGNEDMGSFSGVKIKVALFPLFKKTIKINDVRADYASINLTTNANGELILPKIVNTGTEQLNIISKIRFKNYVLNIKDNFNNIYSFIGKEFLISDFKPNKHVNLSTIGRIVIDNKKYVDYDILLNYDGVTSIDNLKIDFADILSLIKNNKITASLVADLKVKNRAKKIHADGTLSLDKISFDVDGNKLPYSNAAFTFLGNKITIDSSIYTNSDNKLDIAGYLTHSDSPTFNISVKSNEINLKDLLCYVRLFSDLSNLDKIDTIGGKLYADFVLKGSLKKLKSSGIFKVTNAFISSDKLNITGLNSDIDFNDNKIQIKTANAYVNSTPVVVTGDIVSNNFNINLLVDKFKLKNMIYKKSTIESGIISVIANFSGSYKNIIPKIETELFNIVGKYDTVKYRCDRLLVHLGNKNIGNILVSNFIATTPNTKNISIPIMKAKFTESDIDIEPFNMYSNNSKLELFGKILNYNNENISFSIKSSGFINPKSLFNIEFLDNVYPVMAELNGNKLSQNVNLQVLENNSKSKISFNQPVIYNLFGKIVANEFKILDAGVNSYNGVFSTDLKKNILSSTKFLALSGSVNQFSNPKFKNLRLNILKTCPLNIYHYLVKLNGDIVVNGEWKKPELIGNINIPAISDKYGCLSLKNLTVSITKNISNFNCSNMKIFDTSLSFVGTADTNVFDRFKIKSINLKSKDFDLDNIALMLAYAKNFDFDILIENGCLFAENALITTPISVLMITDLNSSFTLKDNSLHIDTILANMYNGKLAGNIDLDTRTGKYSAFIQGRGVSAGPVMQAVTTLKDNICGKLDFDMSVQSVLNSKYLKNADVKFIIKDGQMSTIGKVEHLLYAQNILADRMLKTSLAVVGRAIAAKDTGLFKYLNGVINIQEDLVNITSMKMLGPNMSLYIKGNYSLITNIAHLDILGRLSNTMVSSLGAFGTFTMDKFKIALSGNETEQYKILQDGVENIPQLPQKNTKEFKAIISGPAESSNSVKSFLWISESIKEYRTKEINESNVFIPKFIDNLPY